MPEFGRGAPTPEEENFGPEQTVDMDIPEDPEDIQKSLKGEMGGKKAAGFTETSGDSQKESGDIKKIQQQFKSWEASTRKSLQKLRKIYERNIQVGQMFAREMLASAQDMGTNVLSITVSHPKEAAEMSARISEITGEINEIMADNAGRL